jgi:hypothetical protein
MIKFVEALGDEVERAAAARIAGRRGRLRRRLAIGGLGFALVATGVAAASGVLSGSPEQLASSGIACFERASLNANVTVVPGDDRTPIETCRQLMGTDSPLVACASEAVHVFPGGADTCRRLGMEPLPPEYAAARAKVEALERAVRRLERSECIPPPEFARRVQALLERSGWTGWTTWLRPDLAEGPCGAVTMPGGDGRRSIEGALDAEGRRVIVKGAER